MTPHLGDPPCLGGEAFVFRTEGYASDSYGFLPVGLSMLDKLPVWEQTKRFPKGQTELSSLVKAVGLGDEGTEIIPNLAAGWNFLIAPTSQK